jgi:uncharacterized protein HemY
MTDDQTHKIMSQLTLARKLLSQKNIPGARYTVDHIAKQLHDAEEPKRDD